MATSTTDYITGLYSAFGAMLALEVRHRTGKGQVIDAALYEGAFSFMEPHVPAYGKDPGPPPPSNVFPSGRS